MGRTAGDAHSLRVLGCQLKHLNPLNPAFSFPRSYGVQAATRPQPLVRTFCPDTCICKSNVPSDCQGWVAFSTSGAGILEPGSDSASHRLHQLRLGESSDGFSSTLHLGCRGTCLLLCLHALQVLEESVSCGSAAARR